jgi:hypothetical protein
MEEEEGEEREEEKNQFHRPKSALMVKFRNAPHLMEYIPLSLNIQRTAIGSFTAVTV